MDSHAEAEKLAQDASAKDRQAFFNATHMGDRDLTVAVARCVLGSVRHPVFADVCCGTGIRGIRVGLALPSAKSVLIDHSQDALRCCKQLLASPSLQNVASQCTLIQASLAASQQSCPQPAPAAKVESSSTPAPQASIPGSEILASLSRSVHVVDIDPFGSARPQWRACLTLLCRPCSHLGVCSFDVNTVRCGSATELRACARGYRGACHAGTHHSGDMAVRCILAALVLDAAEHGLLATPMLSLSSQFAVRIWVQLQPNEHATTLAAAACADLLVCAACGYCGRSAEQQRTGGTQVGTSLKGVECSACGTHRCSLLARNVFCGAVQDAAFAEGALQRLQPRTSGNAAVRLAVHRATLQAGGIERAISDSSLGSARAAPAPSAALVHRGLPWDLRALRQTATRSNTAAAGSMQQFAALLCSVLQSSGFTAAVASASGVDDSFFSLHYNCSAAAVLAAAQRAQSQLDLDKEDDAAAAACGYKDTPSPWSWPAVESAGAAAQGHRGGTVGEGGSTQAAGCICKHSSLEQVVPSALLATLRQPSRIAAAMRSGSAGGQPQDDPPLDLHFAGGGAGSTASTQQKSPPAVSWERVLSAVREAQTATAQRRSQAVAIRLFGSQPGAKRQQMMRLPASASICDHGICGIGSLAAPPQQLALPPGSSVTLTGFCFKVARGAKRGGAAGQSSSRSLFLVEGGIHVVFEDCVFLVEQGGTALRATKKCTVQLRNCQVSSAGGSNGLQADNMAVLLLHGLSIKGFMTGVEVTAGSVLCACSCSVRHCDNGFRISHESEALLAHCSLHQLRKSGILVHAAGVAVISACSISRCGRGAVLASDAAQVAVTGLSVKDVSWAALSALEGSSIAVGGSVPTSISSVRCGVALRCMDSRSAVLLQGDTAAPGAAPASER